VMPPELVGVHVAAVIDRTYLDAGVIASVDLEQIHHAFGAFRVFLS